MGADDAATLMDHLPYGGWGDVARQRDLLEVERRLELRIESSESRLRADFHREIRSVVFATLASNTALASIAVAIALRH